MTYDVVIVGGGPAGLSAALVLGRARKRVLLCDSGQPRNAAAEHIQGFVTQDGTPPREFRRIAREQLRPYENVELRDVRVTHIDGQAGQFRVGLGGSTVEARRILLAVGLVDVLPELPGYRDLWGKSLFQCPFCHGWEARDRALGVQATAAPLLEFALFLTGWSRDIIAFTESAFEVPSELRERVTRAGVRLEERRIRGLRAQSGHLAAVQLEDGSEVPREVLFVRPPQRQTELVQSLGVALDEQGFVRVNEHRETSVPGIFAAGDLTTLLQGALMAASAGAQAAYMLSHALTLEALAQQSPPG